MRIIGYSYDADIRCIHHAVADYQDGYLKRPGPLGVLHIDEQRLPDDLIGREGNRVMPIFDTDEGEHICGACLEYITIGASWNQRVN
ncbi:MAG: hypothetical protein F4Y44_02525 [Chloroflexi bacterium]|nr:hypothetical protein [Chloroflexota bacterium]